MHATSRDATPPLTRSVEDYLKAIYGLSSQGGFATTSDIAGLLAVAPPSVSGMVKRLSEAGLIETCRTAACSSRRRAGARRCA